jgi:hypothetical protein
MNIISLNQLVNWFNDFSQRHFFLNDFGFGEMYDIGTSRQMNLPYMWLSLNDGSTITTANKTIIPVISFNVMVVDKVNIQPNYQDTNGFNSDNAHEILSDTLQTINDLIVEIQQSWGYYGIMLNSDVNIFPVVDETPDKIYGFNAVVNLKLRYVNCDIPASPINN